MIDIGKRIKQLRIKNSLTLEELASRTELTKGFLSQLERNLTAPSLQTLEDISEALGTTMSEFFKEEKEEQVVFTANDAFIDEQDDFIIHWIVPNAQKNDMEPIILKLHPLMSSKVIEPHEGQEMGYVLSGKVYLCQVDDPKGIPVNKGDTFYINGDKAHYLKNKSNRDAEILWISTPPVF